MFQGTKSYGQTQLGSTKYTKQQLEEAIAVIGADEAHFTTLTLKNVMRKLYPGQKIVQSDVSDDLHAMHNAGLLEGRDLGQWYEFWQVNRGKRHYSVTKGTWVYLADMHTSYLLNVMSKYIRRLLDAQTLKPEELIDLDNVMNELQGRAKKRLLE